MSASRVVLSVFGVFLLAFGAWLYLSIEWVEKQVDLGPGEEAQRNDFLAAELFLRHYGLETETVTGMGLLDELPSTEDALVLSASREALSDRRRNALIEWVERGGKLVLVAHAVFDPERQASDDPLLDRLGLFLIEPGVAGDDAEQAREEDVAEASEAFAEGLVPEARTPVPSGPEGIAAPAPAESSEGDDAEEPLVDAPETLAELLEEAIGPAPCWGDPSRLDRIATTDVGELSLELETPHELAVYESDLEDAVFSAKAQVAQVPVGEGEALVFTSVAPFRNRRIHCQDHAFFLRYSLDGRRKVWLLHDPAVPSLAALAVRELPFTLAGGLGLLLVGVAAASIRYGVAPPADEAPRRALREHLEATVVFHFRKGGFAALFDRLRDDLIRHGPRDRERWAERAGLDAESREQALSESVPWSRREIPRRVRNMLRLRAAMRRTMRRTG